LISQTDEESGSEGSAISTFEIPLSASSTVSQTFTYTNAQPGPVPSIQNIPHPSDVTITGYGGVSNWLFAPDVGSDLIRIYHIKKDGSLLECPPVATKPGDGPVKASFAEILPEDDGPYIAMYVANSLSNTITYYQRNASFAPPCLEFDEIQTIVPYPPGESIPSTARVATVSAGDVAMSIVIQNDGRFGGNDSFVSLNTGEYTSSGIPGDDVMNFGSIASLYGKSPSFQGVLPYLSPYAFIAIANRVSGTVVVVLEDSSGPGLGPILAEISLGPAGSLEDPHTGLSAIMWYQ
jgi:hypothetical protein